MYIGSKFQINNSTRSTLMVVSADRCSLFERLISNHWPCVMQAAKISISVFEGVPIKTEFTKKNENKMATSLERRFLQTDN